MDHMAVAPTAVAKAAPDHDAVVERAAICANRKSRQYVFCYRRNDHSGQYAGWVTCRNMVRAIERSNPHRRNDRSGLWTQLWTTTTQRTTIQLTEKERAATERRAKARTAELRANMIDQ